MIINDDLLRQIEALALDAIDTPYTDIGGLPCDTMHDAYYETDEVTGDSRAARKVLKNILTPNVVIEIMRRYRAMESLVNQQQEIIKWQ